MGCFATYLCIFYICYYFPPPPLYLSLYKCVNLFLCVCVCVCGGRGPPHQMLLAGAVPVVLQKGAQPTCFSTPSSTIRPDEIR
jgi:hypothetical protein